MVAVVYFSGEVRSARHSDGDVSASVVVQVANSGRVSEVAVVFCRRAFARRQHVQSREEALRKQLSCKRNSKVNSKCAILTSFKSDKEEESA